MTPDTPPLPQRLLAFDTSTERLSVAVGPAGGPALARYEGPGAAQSSTDLIPTLQRLLDEVGWTLAGLDGIVLGYGPGSFTGLRTACAVAQGLAVAARPGGVPVLPVNTLLAVADEGLAQWRGTGDTDGTPPSRLLAVLDARMDEVYAAFVSVQSDQTLTLDGPPWLSAPEHLPPPDESRSTLLAGNALPVYGSRFGPWCNAPQVVAFPTASSLLRVARNLWADCATDAVHAQPLYVRDKVAQTTEERERIKAAKAQASAGAEPMARP